MTIELNVSKPVLLPPTPAYKDEPTCPAGVATTFQVLQAIKWYQDNWSDEKLASSFEADLVLTKRFLSLAICERLVARGFVLPEMELTSMARMRDDYKTFVAKAAAEKLLKDTAKTNKPDVIQLTKAKAFAHLGLIEAQMDKLMHSDEVFNWYEFAQGQGVKAAHVPFILAEIKVAKRYLETPEAFDVVVNDLERIQANGKSIRKVNSKKRKLLKPGKVVGNLQFCAESNEFKVKSIAAERIHGAKSLWIFHTQYREIWYYEASGHSGLTIAGTTLKNWEPTESTAKKLRKPLEQLPMFMGKTQAQCKKLVNELATKPMK
ncbi:MAG: hypothetical protein ACREQ5_12810, partial [Candidatus Dormibacteria bacterium]